MLYTNLLEIFLISILPITLIRFKIISSKFRLFILGGVFLLIFILVYIKDISFFDLGFRLDNLYSGVTPYFFIAIFSIFFISFLAKLMKTKVRFNWYKDPHFLFFFIPISFFQQFIFQGFILYKLQLVFDPVSSIIITGLIFGYMHVIYPRPVFSFFLGLLAGLVFATLYTLHPNIYVSSLAHSILNFTVVYYGFFSFVDSSGVPKKTELNFRY